MLRSFSLIGLESLPALWHFGQGGYFYRSVLKWKFFIALQMPMQTWGEEIIFFHFPSQLEQKNQNTKYLITWSFTNKKHPCPGHEQLPTHSFFCHAYVMYFIRFMLKVLAFQPLIFSTTFSAFKSIYRSVFIQVQDRLIPCSGVRDGHLSYLVVF